jgi:hypothetical protein
MSLTEKFQTIGLITFAALVGLGLGSIVVIKLEIAFALLDYLKR